MNILIVGLKNNQQLSRLVEEGKSRGHEVKGCYTSDLLIKASSKDFTPTLKGESFEKFDVIYLWAVCKRRWEWVTAASFLAKKYNIKIVNNKVIDPTFEYYLTPAVDYLRQLENGVNFPESFIVFNSKAVEQIRNNLHFPIIVKMANGRQGKGVYKADSLEELKKYIDKIDTESGQPAVIREFIPNDGDIRVFTVGYKAIGAMKRTPKLGDFRSNISQGGSGAPFDLNSNPVVKEVAERLSEITRTEIAGVDIILHKDTGEAFVLEVNPGPQFSGLEQYTSTNAALEIIKYFETLV